MAAKKKENQADIVLCNMVNRGYSVKKAKAILAKKPKPEQEKPEKE